MFNDPNHPELQQLAEHHDQGTSSQIPVEQAANAVQSFVQNADPQLVQQVSEQHFDNMSPAQLQQAATELIAKLQQVAGSSPEAAALAQVNPANATPEQVAKMHHFLLKEHPELTRDVLIGGAATLAVGAFAAFAAKRYLAHHGR